MDEKALEIRQEQKEIDLVPSFAISIEESQTRLKQLETFIKSQMIEGEDFGKIPGCPKPSLLKPGAEKLATLYGFSPRFNITDSVKNWQEGFFHYQLKCELVSKRTGFIIAEGVGSCNSKEKKYRTQDAFTLDNTILKMAKKRALVDAVLTATRTSGIFTQDVEDIGADVIPADTETFTNTSNTTTTHKVTTAGTYESKLATENQQKAIYAICKKQGMTDEEIKEMIKVEFNTDHTRNLTMSQASKLIDRMQPKA